MALGFSGLFVGGGNSEICSDLGFHLLTLSGWVEDHPSTLILGGRMRDSPSLYLTFSREFWGLLGLPLGEFGDDLGSSGGLGGEVWDGRLCSLATTWEGLAWVVGWALDNANRSWEASSKRS